MSEMVSRPHPRLSAIGAMNSPNDWRMPNATATAETAQINIAKAFFAPCSSQGLIGLQKHPRVRLPTSPCSVWRSVQQGRRTIRLGL